MLWIFLSVLCSILFTVQHIISKRILLNKDSEYLAFARVLITSVLVLPFIYYYREILIITKMLLLFLILVGIVTALVQILYMKSLKYGKLSKTAPLLNLSSIFVIPFAFFMVNELPVWYGIIGVILIVVGTYILNIEKLNKKNIFEPFFEIIKNTGSRYAFSVAVLWGFGSVLDKIGITNSSPLTWILIYGYSTLFFQGLFLMYRDRHVFNNKLHEVFRGKFLDIFLLSIISLGVVATQFFAISLTYTVYVIAVKRASALLAVIAGYFLFKEKKYLATTLVGTLIMFIGALLIII